MLNLEVFKTKGKDFFWSFVIILCLKMLYFSIFGVSVQPDSFNYIFHVFDFGYPIIYPYFLHFAQIIHPGLELAVVLQTLVFSFCAALFVSYFISNRKQLLLLSLLIGLEPTSSLLCTDIMSEALFMAILFCWVVAVHAFFSREKYSIWLIIAISFVSTILYLERFAGIFFVFAFLFLCLVIPAHRKRFLLTLVVIIISFQVFLLPARLKNKQVIDTYSISNNSGASLWNNASFLYSTSSVQKNPSTDFEKFLAQFDSSNFTAQNAIKGLQYDDHTLPFQSYMTELHYNQESGYKASNEVGVTAFKLISQHPFRYITEYVIPNFTQFFISGQCSDATIYSDNFTGRHLPRVYHSTVYYPSIEWISIYLLLLLSIILYAVGKRPLIARILIGLSCLYLLILPFVCVLGIRHEIILIPLLIACLFMQSTKRKSEKHYTFHS